MSERTGRTVVEPGVYSLDDGSVRVNLPIAAREDGNGISVMGEKVENLASNLIIAFSRSAWDRLIEETRP